MAVKVWKCIYATEEAASTVDAILIELMNTRPELGLDMDATWDAVDFNGDDEAAT